MLIIRSNFINTASGIVFSVGDHSGVQVAPPHQTLTYREYYIRCCIDTILPPDDEHTVARNM